MMTTFINHMPPWELFDLTKQLHAVLGGTYNPDRTWGEMLDEIEDKLDIPRADPLSLWTRIKRAEVETREYITNQETSPMAIQDMKVALWRNNKDGNEARPDLTGTLKDEDDNVVGYVSLWKNGKKTSDKSPVMTGKIQPPQDKKRASSKKSRSDADDDDEVDF